MFPLNVEPDAMRKIYLFACLLVLLIGVGPACGEDEQRAPDRSDVCELPTEEPQDCYVSEESLRIRTADDLQIFCSSPCSKVKNMSIWRVEGVRDLRMLARIQSIDALSIAHTSDLESFDGLQAVSHIRTLTIEANERLENIDGLSGLQSLDTAKIHDNAVLKSIDGLKNIQSVPNQFGLNIAYNPQLESVRGLAALEETALLRIHLNPKLTSLEGLEALRRVEVLDISWNRGLESIDALEGLEEVETVFTMFENTKLPQCEVDALIERLELTRLGRGLQQIAPNGEGMCS